MRAFDCSVGAATLILLTGCGGNPASPTTPATEPALPASVTATVPVSPPDTTLAATPPSAALSTSAVAVDDLADLDQDLPGDAGAIELGTLAPPINQPFCTAWSSVPWDWINDAVVPLQYWIDTYAGVTDVPAAAADALTALQNFADQRMQWNFKLIDVRPEFTAELTLAALAVADAAVADCESLPTVITGPTLDGRAAASADGCAAELSAVERAIAGFVERQGRQPAHIEQVEIEAFHQFAFLGGELFVALDGVGVTVDANGKAVGKPAGPCVS